MATPQSAAGERLQASHDLRRRFETVAYVAGGGIVIAVCTLLVVGIAMPPPAHCAPATACVAPPDWGAAIVAKAQAAKDVLLDLILALGGWTGVTLARGHMDARLPGKEDKE
jgi:hypothetical protein